MTANYVFGCDGSNADIHHRVSEWCNVPGIPHEPHEIVMDVFPYAEKPLTAADYRPKTPGMLRLVRILEGWETSTEEPKVTFQELAVRADLVKSIQPGVYSTAWKFVPKPERDYMFYIHRYWQSEVQAACLIVDIQDLGTYKIQGQFDLILSQIDREG